MNNKIIIMKINHKFQTYFDFQKQILIKNWNQYINCLIKFSHNLIDINQEFFSNEDLEINEIYIK